MSTNLGPEGGGIYLVDRLEWPERSVLDCIRALAALYVVAHHLVATGLMSLGRLDILFRFGQEAVIVFFILSGYVIFYSEARREDGIRFYYLRRIRRIYPTLLGAMLVSSIVGLIVGSFREQFNWLSLIGTLSGLQDTSALKPGVIVDPYLGNSPLWSLSYEMIFYLVFPVLKQAYRRYPVGTSAGVSGVSTLAYIGFVIHPDHFLLVASYLVVWWSGAAVAGLRFSGDRKEKLVGLTAVATGLIAIVTVTCVVTVTSETPAMTFGIYPILQLRHFSVAVVVFMIAIYSPSVAVLAKPTPILVVGRYLSSISFGLYVLHWPILIQLGTYLGGLAATMVGLLALLVLVADLIDRKLQNLLVSNRKLRSGRQN